jgi:hypothetical protein
MSFLDESLRRAGEGQKRATDDEKVPISELHAALLENTKLAGELSRKNDRMATCVMAEQLFSKTQDFFLLLFAERVVATLDFQDAPKTISIGMPEYAERLFGAKNHPEVRWREFQKIEVPVSQLTAQTSESERRQRQYHKAEWAMSQVRLVTRGRGLSRLLQINDVQLDYSSILSSGVCVYSKEHGPALLCNSEEEADNIRQKTNAWLDEHWPPWTNGLKPVTSGLAAEKANIAG